MDRDVIPWLVVVVFASIWVAYIVRARRQSGQMAERSEALFRSMFSELQPYFHPHKLIEYVRARRDRTQSRSGGVWKNPPGFGVESAEIDYEQGRERVRLRDPTGAERAAFVYEESEEGGVLRVGKGKITVNLQDENHPRVRYWHPDREFKWKGGIWKFQSRIADREIESGDSTRFSGESSSSSPGPSIARGAAAAGGIVAAGGAFDGGGAHASWDGASGESASQGSGGSGAFEGGASESSVSSSPAY